MTSRYLDRPLRTVEEVRADFARAVHEARDADEAVRLARSLGHLVRWMSNDRCGRDHDE